MNGSLRRIQHCSFHPGNGAVDNETGLPWLYQAIKYGRTIDLYGFKKEHIVEAQ